MIDIKFDFTTDSYRYWDGFWERNNGLGAGYSDPDSSSTMLQEYHRILWSRELPNGEKMELQKGSQSKYLTWKDFRFGSDSIIVSFRYKKYRYIIDQIREAVQDYKSFVEDYVKKSYTIGGMIIFPKHRGSINQDKGTNSYISDRWDLTLECIRRFYVDEWSPLYNTLMRDKEFFDLFIDFPGYINYFFLQDCVSDDYNHVNIWTENTDFVESALPKKLEEFSAFFDQEFKFLEKRNQRIDQFVRNNSSF